MKIERNSLCSCGSGKKYKKCCLVDEKKRDTDKKEMKRDVEPYKFRSLIGISSFILNPTFKLHCLVKKEYKGSNIYIFQYAAMFQYLFEFQGEIYQDHFFYKPKLKRRFLAFFGKSIYTKEEIKYGEQVMLSAAMDSIDALLTPIPYKAPVIDKLIPSNK